MNIYIHNNNLFNKYIICYIISYTSYKRCLTHLFVLAPLDAFLFPISWVGKLHPHHYPGHMNKTGHYRSKLVSWRVCISYSLFRVRSSIIVATPKTVLRQEREKINLSQSCLSYHDRVCISVVTVKLEETKCDNHKLGTVCLSVSNCLQFTVLCLKFANFKHG